MHLLAEKVIIEHL